MSRRAVVVGVNKYLDPKLAELRGAEKDAEEVRDQLRQFGRFEIPENACLLGERATYLAVREAVSDLLYSSDKQSLSLFYFSGHGFPDGYDDGYLATYDVDCKKPWIKGFQMKELKELFLKTKNKTAAILILDCCYSGIAAEGDKAGPEPATSDLSRQFKDAEGAFSGSGRVVITASGKDRTTREKRDCMHTLTGAGPHDHGFFTYHLLEAFDGGAVSNVEGAVSLASLLKFFEEKMDKQNGPIFYSSSLQRADEIIILNQSRRSKLKVPIERVREDLKEEGPLALFRAAQGLAAVCEIAPNLQEACELKSMIVQRLTGYKSRWQKFLRENTRVIYKSVGQKGLASLTDLVAKLTFDRMVDIGDTSSGDLFDLYRADCGELTKEDYCERLRANLPDESIPSLNPSPLVHTP